MALSCARKNLIENRGTVAGITRHLGDRTLELSLYDLSYPLSQGVSRLKAKLALVLYLVVRGGLLTSFESLNIHGIAGLAGLSGMFTYHATVKLRDVLDVLFGTQKEEKV